MLSQSLEMRCATYMLFLTSSSYKSLRINNKSKIKVTTLVTIRVMTQLVEIWKRRIWNSREKGLQVIDRLARSVWPCLAVIILSMPGRIQL